MGLGMDIGIFYRINQYMTESVTANSSNQFMFTILRLVLRSAYHIRIGHTALHISVLRTHRYFTQPHISPETYGYLELGVPK